MSSQWLAGAQVHDLHPAIGNGPFTTFLGVVLHVNVAENGTPDTFWGNGNPGQVCPNFQVYKDGSIHQMLPMNWQPWCQVDGNFNYAAIETAGMPTEPLTAAQVEACGRIVAAYHTQFGMPLQEANAPGQGGLGVHSMGGVPWGGHSCPGPLRAAQRPDILAAATPPPAPPTPTGSTENAMWIFRSSAAKWQPPVLVTGATATILTDHASVVALLAAGAKPVTVAPADFARLSKVAAK